jgi:hypothetical protein
MKPSELRPGFLYDDVSEADYHTREYGVASKHALDLVLRAPALYPADLAKPHEGATPALAFGQAVHCAVLEPVRFEVDYRCEPDFGDCRKKENKAARDAWREENAGKVLVGADDWGAIGAMRLALERHPLASRILSADGARAELTLRWDDEEHGVLCKGRADLYIPELRTCVDLKTSADASYDAFRRDIAVHGYHRQDAMYRAGFDACSEPLEHFLFVVVEKEPPYLVAVYALDDAARAHGAKQVRRLIERFADCLAKNEWPGYPEGIQEIELPRWAAA